MKFPKKGAFLLAIIAGTCWGTHGTFASLMGAYGISDGTVALIAPLFYGLFFLVLLVRDDIHHLKVSASRIPLLLVYGLVSAVYSYAIIKAYWHMPVGIVHTIVFSSLFLLIFLSRLVFKDPLTWQKIVASFLAVVGIGLLLNVFGTPNWSVEGLIWTGLSLVSWSLLVMLEKYFLIKGMNGNAILVYSGFFGILFVAFVVPPVGAVLEIVSAVVNGGGRVLLPLGGFALITSVGAYYFYLQALMRLDPAYVQLGYVMDPLTASVLGFFVFGQAFAPIQIVGAAMILFVVIWVEGTEIKMNRESGGGAAKA